jgi:hypothetical protein
MVKVLVVLVVALAAVLFVLVVLVLVGVGSDASGNHHLRVLAACVLLCVSLFLSLILVESFFTVDGCAAHAGLC